MKKSSASACSTAPGGNVRSRPGGLPDIGPGQTVLDVGCGPGYASLDLAELVGPSGRVVAVDKSERFLHALDAASRERGLDNITTHLADLDAGEFPDVIADRAWARWVLRLRQESSRRSRACSCRPRTGWDHRPPRIF